MVAGFWNRRPCNLRHSAHPVGTRQYFDEVENRKYFVESHIPGFAEFPRWNGKKVLEIGCGIGTDTVNFARQGAFVTAVDLSERSLELAKTRAELYGLQDRIRFIQGNAEELTRYVPTEPYDLIYSFGVLHHTPDPKRTLDQLRFYCHPETVVKLMFYHRYAWKVLGILLTHGNGRFWKLSELVARYSETQEGCLVTYIFSRNQLKALLRQYGFIATDLRVDHIFPYSIPEYRQYRYVKVWYFRWIPRPVFRWLERHCGWHLCVTAKKARVQ